MKAFFQKIHTDDFTWMDSLITIIVIFVSLYMANSVLHSLTLYNLLDPHIPDTALSHTAAFYFSFIVMWITFVLFCVIVTRYRFIPLSFLAEFKAQSLGKFLAGALIGFAANGICILFAALHKDIILTFDAFKLPALLLMFAAVLVQSGAEEFVYRGFLYRCIRKGYKKPAVAIICSSLLFSMGHLMNPGVTPLAVAGVFMGGLFFAVIVYRFDSLLAAIAAHTLWNYTQNVIFGLPNSGLVFDFSIMKLDAASASDSFFYSAAFGVEGSLFSVIVLLIGSALLLFTKKGRPQKERPL